MNSPELQQSLLDLVLPRMAADERVVGVAVAGSLASGTGDEFSDIDLVVVIDDAAYPEVSADRLEAVGSWARLVAGFTGEHVGEPRVVITLAGPPLVHVDVKLVDLAGFADRVADPSIVHDPAGLLARAIAEHPLVSRPFDVQWVEDRFWVWVHYAATKLGRGELFEVLDHLAFVRGAVLGPLAALHAGVEPRGVRQLERLAPVEAAELRATVSGYDRADAARAVVASVELYRRWREGHDVEKRALAEELAMDYLAGILARDEVAGPS